MNKKSGFIIAILLLVILGGAYKFIIKGSTIDGTDGRVVILLDAEERNYILKEMRGLLGHMQQLITAISNDDMDEVIKIADTLVKDSGGQTPTRIIAKMPIAFKKISMNIHNDFKDLQAMTKKNKNSKEALKQVSKIMQNCLACHSSHSLMPKEKT
jgi:hypothetical protein